MAINVFANYCTFWFCVFFSHNAEVNDFLPWKLFWIFCIGKDMCICFGPLPCIFLCTFTFFYHVSLLKYCEVPCYATVCVFMHDCNVSIGPQKPLCLHCLLVLSGCRPVPPPVVTQTVSLTKAFVTLLF